MHQTPTIPYTYASTEYTNLKQETISNNEKSQEIFQLSREESSDSEEDQKS